MVNHNTYINFQVKCPNLQSREGHCAATFGIRPGQIEVVIFGGCPKWKKHPKTEADYPQIADTTLLIFSESIFVDLTFHLVWV